MKGTTLLPCAAVFFAYATGAFADTAQTIPFLTQLLPANETPAISDTSTGTAIVLVHVIRDSGGNITSGSVDFDVSTKFSSAVTITGLHIHNAAAGVAGPIVIPTDVTGTSVGATGIIRIQKQVQVPQTAPPTTVATIVDLLNNPQNYYVNIHTPDHPGGAMRGQLVPADMTVVMGLMSPANEVPPTTSNGSAVATVVVLRSRDAAGNLVYAAVTFNAIYTGMDAASSGTIFTGFHIHNGPAGVNGPVVINTGISGTNSVAIDPSGSGTLNYLVPVAQSDTTFAAEAVVINGLFDNPGGFYINVHSDKFPGGVARDQLRNTDSVTYQVSMLPANETPPITGLAASGTSAVTIYTIRNADDTVAAGTALFDINFRGFPAATTFTGLHIHDGPAGVAGPVTINTGLSAGNTVVTDSGNGNIYRFVTVTPGTTGLATLNSLVKDPSQQYVNLHTTVNPGGAIRSQLAVAAVKPSVIGVAANASTITHAAPGSILSIFGTNLAPSTSGLGAFRGLKSLPTALNGVSVTIAGFNAPFYFVSPLQINVQVPFEVPAGTQPLVVTTAGGVSTTLNITVDAVAPSLFIVDSSSNLGAVVKNSDFSLTTKANPAKVGDFVVIYSTGLGQSTPAASTGVLLVPPGTAFNNTATVTVTIGGQPATVIYSIASPAFVGLYQTAVMVPTGVTGTVPVVLMVGTVKSNTVNMVVQ
jgi:uncharacterized protein (TIGR03437 family)